MIKLKQIINYFIHNDLRKESHVFYRAYVFVGLVLFLTVSTVFVEVIIEVFNFSGTPNLFFPIFFFTLALYSLKRYGNLVITSNFLVAICFITLAPTVYETGGILSDNLIWLFITPLIGLLFGNKFSGLFWLFILLGFTYHIYDNTNNEHIRFITSSDKSYYLTSYLFLFCFLYGIVIIFEKGQALIIRMLNKQKELLERQKAEIAQKNEELETIQAALRHSNAELENFAFAASHDLKEPLRMIKMYSGFTQKRLVNVEDKSVKEFMGYVTDGAARMETLLNDLLQYSRLGKKKEDVKDIDLNNTLFLVIHNLLATMKDTQASIMANKLPIVEASHTEMVQLFQNLIANSIKFRKEGILPEIKIYSQDTGPEYLISFADNGIGIKEEYHEKVFGIFERVHKASEYEGTGIGLATCKKIVNSSGGKIWLESAEGVGTTFFFTFPKPHMN